MDESIKQECPECGNLWPIDDANFETRALHIADEIFPIGEPPSHSQVTEFANRIHELLRKSPSEPKAAGAQSDERHDAPLSVIPELVKRDEIAVNTALLEMSDAMVAWRTEVEKHQQVTSRGQSAFCDGYEAGMAAILSARAAVAQAGATSDAAFWRDLLDAVIRESDDGEYTHPWTGPENAPGHAHDIPGVWDTDNRAEIAGKPCSWCLTWNKARAALAGQPEPTREPGTSCDPADPCAGCRCKYNQYSEPESRVEVTDTELLDWVMHRLSGKALRDIGVVYSEGDPAATRAAIVAARAGDQS
ncbi:hypothetical protein [Burkholderia cenocepacia]|uniref:hypothetical protein n=1 Tax=Burkholderia cenocepacia TaxID=95486 RepID=UPI000A950D1D|nr:hypothetical protein [Burkholderia cenocepacia]